MPFLARNLRGTEGLGTWAAVVGWPGFKALCSEGEQGQRQGPSLFLNKQPKMTTAGTEEQTTVSRARGRPCKQVASLWAMSAVTFSDPHCVDLTFGVQSSGQGAEPCLPVLEAVVCSPNTAPMDPDLDPAMCLAAVQVGQDCG